MRRPQAATHSSAKPMFVPVMKAIMLPLASVFSRETDH